MTQPDLQRILEGIHNLMKERSHLLTSDLSPEGAWIHEYEVKRLYLTTGFQGVYRYAKWQADQPIFKRNPKRNARPPRGKDPEFTHHQHIGRVGSNTGLGSEPEVEAAYAAHNNRQRLEAIDQALCEIRAILSKFEKRGTGVMPAETD